MKTTLFLSVSLDGLISDQQGVPSFPSGAWEDWCALVNEADNVIAGRASCEQLQGDETSAVLHPTHKVVLSSRDVALEDSSWQHARSPAEALEILKNVGVEEAIVGGGRAIAHAFMREGLVDNFIVDLQPVVFGLGTPVFGEELDMTQFELIDSRPLNDNAIRLRYQVVRGT